MVASDADSSVLPHSNSVRVSDRQELIVTFPARAPVTRWKCTTAEGAATTAGGAGTTAGPTRIRTIRTRRGPAQGTAINAVNMGSMQEVMNRFLNGVPAVTKILKPNPILTLTQSMNFSRFMMEIHINDSKI